MFVSAVHPIAWEYFRVWESVHFWWFFGLFSVFSSQIKLQWDWLLSGLSCTMCCSDNFMHIYSHYSHKHAWKKSAHFAAWETKAQRDKICPGLSTQEMSERPTLVLSLELLWTSHHLILCWCAGWSPGPPPVVSHPIPHICIRISDCWLDWYHPDRCGVVVPWM